MRVLGLSGSLRRESYNLRLVRAAARALPPGAELEVWEELADVPPFSEDAERVPAPVAVAELRAVVARADALLISTPEYNGSVPGQLKNALDWLSRPYAASVLRGLPVAVVGASTGPFGAVWAQADLRRILGFTGARVLDRDLPVGHAYLAFAEDGSLVDPAVAATLGGIVQELVEAAAPAAAPGGAVAAAA